MLRWPRSTLNSMRLSLSRVAAGARVSPKPGTPGLASRSLSGATSIEDQAAAAARAERLARHARMAAIQKQAGTTAGSGGAGQKGAAAAGANKSDSGMFFYVALLVSAAGGILYSIYDIKKNPNGTLGKMYKDSWVETTINNMSSDLDSVYMPASDSLLMPYERGSFYGEDLLPGSPAPPLLVLDLEKTLIGSEYDAKYGWRHVKRPGLQRFLNRMTQYYEVVIVSENEVGEIQSTLDPDNKCHKHGPSTMEVRRDVMLKRLDLMNRDLSRVILIDDSEEASSLFPRNTLLVKPFTNVHDAHDTTLDDLTLLLSALVHDGVGDFRACFDKLGTHEAEEAVIEYKMRLRAAKERERQKRERGLGLLLKNSSSLAKDQKKDDDELLDPEQGSVLSKIVGTAPSGSFEVGSVNNAGSGNSTKGSKVIELAAAGVKGVVAPLEARKEGTKKKGALFQWLEDSEAEKARLQELKIQHMNEVHTRRMREKLEAAQAERERAQREEELK